MRTLICNADDYGLSPAVSRGILEAQRGVVRATSVMSTFVTVSQIEALVGRGLSIAAHLNLSTGRPLSDGYPAALLRPDGCFDKPRALAASTWTAAEHVEAAQREWRAQLLRLDELGVRIDHLDSHHHTHMLPGLLEPLIELAVELGLPLRSRPVDAARLRARGVPTPDDFVESYFGAGRLHRAALLEALRGVRGAVVELMCHPGRVDAELRQWSGYVEERERELELLADPALADEFAAAGWTLAGYEAVR